MATEFVSRAFLDIEGQIVVCESLNFRMTTNTEPAKEMTQNNRSRGYMDGVPEWEGSAKVNRPLGGFPVDFNKLARDRTEFVSTKVFQDGTTQSYLRCRITEINDSSEAGSSSNVELTIKALDSDP
ncbi:MAG: hypothetical protein KC503_17380 [Myxococcales bacterium]|nr:hypothetical protein [Myxococcales bacterium]